MIPEDLEAKIITAINQNKRPFYVNATAGTTVMGAFDDLTSIADICLKFNIWMHVDVRTNQYFMPFFAIVSHPTNSRLVSAAA